MGAQEDIRKTLEAGVKLGRQRAEDLVRDLLHEGESTRERADNVRDHAEELLEELYARGRKGTEMVREMIRAEVRRELESYAKERRDELVDLVRRGVGLVGDYLAGSGAAEPGPDSATDSTRDTDESPGASVTELARRTPRAGPRARTTPAKKATPITRAAPTKRAARATKSGAVDGGAPRTAAPGKKAGTPRKATGPRPGRGPGAAPS